MSLKNKRLYACAYGLSLPMKNLLKPSNNKGEDHGERDVKQKSSFISCVYSQGVIRFLFEWMSANALCIVRKH